MDQKTTDARLKALQSVLSEVDKKFGKGAIIDMTGRSLEDVPAISTQALPLDIALGIGGLAKGRIIEIYGPESSGKTTLCYHLIAEVQKNGGTAAFIDTEHAMDPKYAKAVGVDIDAVLVSQPSNGEEALDIAELLVESGIIELIVIDSVAALTPLAEINGEMGDSSVGVQARLMSKACRILAPKASKTGTTIVFTNQLREKIGVMFGSPETQPGGRALKFYASQRLDIRRIETIKEGTEAIGNRVRVKVVKNKVAPPFKQAEFVISFGVGVDRNATILEMHLNDKDLENGITKSGAFIKFKATDEQVQGKAKAVKYLVEHPEVADSLEQEIKDLYLGSGKDISETEFEDAEPAGFEVEPGDTAEAA